MKETTCLSPLRSRDNFFKLLFILGGLPKVEGCGLSGQLPGVNVYTRTVKREAQLHGSCERI